VRDYPKPKKRINVNIVKNSKGKKEVSVKKESVSQAFGKRERNLSEERGFRQ